MTDAFWESKTLSQMTDAEWEAVCDGCGQCCLVKLEDEDTGDIAITRLACHLIDLNTCQCQDYSARCQRVADCIDLKQQDISQYQWLPDTCAYRLLSEGLPLPDWHPLKTGQIDSTRRAGMAIDQFAIHESADLDPEDYIIQWRLA